ncbi:MAG: ABC transporter ATP-binding protein [Clostridia bacterium]|nr:ABC transporter ATP-binding protein [Clostridia bacterium]
MIQVEDITKRYGTFTAVDKINFEIEEGEVVGFLGPNGAGKSTTMNMITGFIESTSGRILVDGYDISKKPKKAKRQIGYMPEGVPLYADLTAKEFVTYMAELKGVKRKERKAMVQKALEDTGLVEVQNQLTRNLSRGYKQRVSLAGALVSNPKVIILDEPTVGLDPKQVTEIRALIKELEKDHTVILSSHILSEVSQICNRVIIINKGKIVAVDTPENLEKKVVKDNSVYVTVEDLENKMNSIKDKLENVQEIRLVKENDDNTKKYIITAEEDVDLRKHIFETFAKEGITIFEMKKIDATLEDAFMQLIGSEAEIEQEEVENEEVLDKKQLKEKKKQEKMEKKAEKQRLKEEKKKEKELKKAEKKQKGGQE